MSRLRPLHALAIAAATTVLLFSPVGQAGLNELVNPVQSGLLAESPGFLSMFPHAFDLGPVPSSQVLDVGVGVPVANAAGLQSFVQATSTPGSPQFQQFLTPGQFDARYAPSAAAYAKDVAYFQQYGVHVQTSSDRLLLGLTGTSSEMGAAFHTSFEEYAVGTSTYYGTTSAAELPSDLDVDGTFGTTNAFNYQPQVVMAPSLGAPASAGPAASCTTDGYSPTEIQDAYRVNELISAGDEGSGMKIAVVDAYDTGQKPTELTTDLNDFDTNCGMASTTPQYQYPVPFPSSVNSSASSGWGGETTLDMQWSHVMAQKATIFPVQTPDAGFSLYSAVNYLVATALVNVISLSWGEPSTQAASGCTSECNASSSGSYQVLHPVLQAAVAEGISVTVASGDCGADDGDGASTPSTDYPASDEDATGVGGSVLTLASNDTWYGSESTTGSMGASGGTWSGNESSCPSNDGAAGGGWAPVPQPWYQYGSDIKNKGLRGVPDVGITVGSWLTIYYSAAMTASAGTSDGAPQWAGLIATADGIAGHGIGLINPDVYAMLRSTDYQYYFHEVDAGSGNGYAPSDDWDPISGVGTPIASNVVPYLATGGYLTTQGSLQAGLSASATSGTAPLTVTFTTTVSGGTGTYPLYSFYWGNGQSVDTKTTTLSYTYTAAGTYAAQVEVFDSSGNSTLTQAIMITVGTTPTLSLALTASSTAPTVGSAVTFTATTTGGTSPFTFGFYFGDGTYIFGGYNAKSTSPDAVTHAYGAAGVYCADATANDSSSPQQGATSNILTILVGGATGSCPSVSTPLAISAAATPTSGTAPLAVTFGSTPSGGSGGNTFAWHFGLVGATSTSQNPSYTYSAAGTYSAWVNVTDSGGTTAKSNVLTITVSATGALTATASASVTSGVAPLAVTFTGSATGGTGGNSYAWYFGLAGATSTLQDPSYTYSGAGTYNAWVNVTDSGGTTAKSNVLVITVTSSAGALTATASASVSSGTAPLSVQFTGSASGGTGVYSSWAWHFGLVGATSASQDPTYSYTTAGTYSAWVNVTDSSGATAKSNALTITVTSSGSTLTASASASTTSGTAPLAVTFTGSATGGSGTYTAWAWHFGDGTTGDTQDPSHTYNAAGSFSAWVNVTDSSGTTAKSNVLTITVSASSGPLAITVSASSTSVAVNTPVSFSSSVSGGTGGTAYAWHLGPSLTSTAADPTETYTAAGTYFVWGNATDSAGTTAMSNVLTVTISAAAHVEVSVGVSSSSLTVGEPLWVNATATGGTAPYSYSWSNLPSGCSGANQASISCTPTAPGEFEISVTATDSSSSDGSATATVWLNVTEATSGTSTASGGSIFGLAPLTFFAIVAVVALVAVALIVLALRPKRNQPASPEAWGYPPESAGEPSYAPPPQ